jgi:hypothetical protein
MEADGALTISEFVAERIKSNGLLMTQKTLSKKCSDKNNFCNAGEMS